MLRRLDLRSSDHVLDLGCAYGVWTAWLDRRVQRVVGVDVDVEALARARSLYPDATFVVADARSLPFADAEFDKVVFISTLEHIRQPEEALAETARVLKPGALLALSVDTLDHAAWYPHRAVHRRRSFVAHYFTRDRVDELAARSGFEPVWGRYLFGNRFAPALLGPRLREKRLHWLLWPLVAATASLDDHESGMIFQSVLRRRAVPRA